MPEVDKLGARARRFSASEALSAESLSLLAHELRKPIAPLRNATEVLRLICADPLQRHALDIVDRQLTQLIGLVEDLVGVAGVRRGGVVLRKQLVDVAGVAEQALETIRPLSDARKQHVQVMLPSERILLLCDRLRLVQILENLLENAVRDTPSGGEIALKIASAGDDLSIEVSDSGRGIPSELLPHIFNLFAQGEQAHGPEGRLGVGLAVVRNLVEIHGGSVRAESGGPGRGSKFVVRLPILKETAEEIANAPSAPAFPPRKILLIEEDVGAAERLADRLRTRGNRVRTAHDGPSGLMAAHEFHPNVVVLDIGLPGADGYLIAEQLRRSPETTDALLIALSGHSSEDVRDRALEKGFNYYLVKPADPESLIEVIEDSPPQDQPRSGD